MNQVSFTSTPVLLCIFVAALMTAQWGTDALTNTMGQLPIDGAHRASRSLSITPDTKIWPLLAESKARLEAQETANLEAAFTRALAPPPVAPPPPPEPPKPSLGDILKNQIRVSAIADHGAYLNGRYYQVGDQINQKVKLLSVSDCAIRLNAGTETVTLPGLNTCKNKERKRNAK